MNVMIVIWIIAFILTLSIDSSNPKRFAEPFSVSGTERTPVYGSSASELTNTEKYITVTLVLRSANLPLVQRYFDSNILNEPLENVTNLLGANTDDINLVIDFSYHSGLDVIDVNQPGCIVKLGGTVTIINSVFGITLTEYTFSSSDQKPYRTYSGMVKIPTELNGIVLNVVGLDTRPIVWRKKSQQAPTPTPTNRPLRVTPTPTPTPIPTPTPTPTSITPTPTPTNRSFRVTPTPTPTPTPTSTPTPTPKSTPTPTPTPTPKSTPTPTPTPTPKSTISIPNDPPFAPEAVAQLYNFPSLDGTGQCILILEFGGGYRDQDVIDPTTISWVSVDGVQNVYDGPNGDSGEVILDIQIVQRIARKSKVVVFFASPTEQGYINALAMMIQNPQCGSNRFVSLSISWGEIESTSSSLITRSKQFLTMYSAGVVVTASSGDDGSNNGGGRNYVNFPASSPYVLGCGGTTIQVSGNQIVSETAWSGSGGGVSDIFPKPSYQSSLSINGRGVPDVSGDGDPDSGYLIIIGIPFTVGGTSAVAPLWASLVALLSQHFGNVIGPLHPKLYNLSPSSGAFNDITTGSNGGFSAKTGWDSVTGLGSPNGVNLMNAIN